MTDSGLVGYNIREREIGEEVYRYSRCDKTVRVRFHATLSLNLRRSLANRPNVSIEMLQ